MFGVSSLYFRCWLKRIRSLYILFLFKKMYIGKMLTATYQIWSKWAHFQAKERPGILKVCLFLQQYWYVVLSILKKVIEVTGKSKNQENINNCRICWKKVSWIRDEYVHTSNTFFRRFIWEESLSFINILSVKYFVIAFCGYPLPLFLPIWTYFIYKIFIH